MKKIIADFEVIDIHFPVKGSYIIRFKSPENIPEIKPGNFAEIHINNSPDVFLRRPFSILDVDYQNRIISFYIKVIGKGTKQLGNYKTGEKISEVMASVNTGKYSTTFFTNNNYSLTVKFNGYWNEYEKLN